jgi:3-dehydroquinate synthetase/predicted NBD/HSP70 family sugar kinase
VNKIAAYIATTTKSCWHSSHVSQRRPSIAISIGAALNAHTGQILGSGPILGEDSSTFDLDLAIRQHFDDINITIVNDVTASLIAHSRMASLLRARRIALITVSTGIASRVLNCSVPHIPVDAVLGTQGEIGHHRISFSVEGLPLSLKCSCGGVDHMNAFVSGEGIKRVLGRIREMLPQEFMSLHTNNGPVSDVSPDVLADGLASDDPFSKKLLKAFTLPIAEAIKWHFMLDPEIDKLILTGGVCFRLGDFYLSSVLENLCMLGFYPLASDPSAFWADRVIMGPLSDDAGLIGAAYVARESPQIHRRETLSADPPYQVSRHNSVDYAVHVVPNIFENEAFPEHLLRPFERIVLVVDSAVDELNGDSLRRLLAGSYRHVDTVVLRTGEKRKDLFAVTELVSSFDALGVRRRRDLVVAAGGGITLDIASLSTNLFRRGVPCLKLPTTLLAAIDAGIGLKNAVNFRQSKSRLGTYSAPYAVVVDPCFLSTLSDRQIRNGLSEALKIALVADRSLFELIEEHGFDFIRTKLQSKYGMELVRRAIRAMLLELSPNLHERTLDRCPDYGHTFSPIFEFELSDLEHGEAVALDMAIATALAAVSGILRLDQAERIFTTQQVLGLPIDQPGVTLDMLQRGLREAKRHRGGRLRMPVLCRIGEATFVDDIGDSQLEEALTFIQSWGLGNASRVSKSA